MLHVLVLITALLIGWLISSKIIKTRRYWQERGVKCVKTSPFNLVTTFAHLISDLYNAHPEERYVGFIQSSSRHILILRDLDLIKTIGVKEIGIFTDHRNFVPEDIDPIWGKNLFASTGQRWRELRPILSPCFTSSKMKHMFTLMNQCAKQFVTYFKDKNEDFLHVEFKDIFSRYTNDVLASTAFGIQCDSLRERNNEFFSFGRETFNLTGIRGIRFLLHGFFPSVGRALRLRLFPKRITDYFSSVIKDTIKYREENNIVRPDMIHLLNEIRRNGRVSSVEIDEGEQQSDQTSKLKQTITLDDIVSQSFVFFFAGFETVAVLICFMAYELALNPDIQNKLIEEVDKVRKENDGEITYENLQSMKYLDMVLSETQRKWPPTPMTDRVANRPYTIEPTKPGEKPLTLEKGTICWIPIFALHRDPKYHPNPDLFDPERFNDENKHKINPMALVAFGAGPRNCIGSRFALLEIKTLMFHLLSNFEIVPTEKSEIPVVLSKNFSLGARNGFHFGFKRRVC